MDDQLERLFDVKFAKKKKIFSLYDFIQPELFNQFVQSQKNREKYIDQKTLKFNIFLVKKRKDKLIKLTCKLQLSKVFFEIKPDGIEDYEKEKFIKFTEELKELIIQ